MIDLYFLIPTVITLVFKPTAELVMLTGKPSNEANTEIETQPVTAEIKRRKYSK